MAVTGLKRPCISTRISTSGPTASRTASTSDDHAPLLRAVQLVEARAERIELERPIALGHHAPGRGVELLRRALDGVPAVGVGLDLVAHGAAEQAVDRLVQRLAHDVPAGDLDQGACRSARSRPCARSRRATCGGAGSRCRRDRCPARSAAPPSAGSRGGRRVRLSARTSPTPTRPSSVSTLTKMQVPPGGAEDQRGHRLDSHVTSLKRPPPGCRGRAGRERRGRLPGCSGG